MNESEHRELYDYVLGLCDEAQTKAVERRIAASESLQSEVAALQDALSDEASALDAVEAPESLLASIVDSIRGVHPFAGFVDRLAEFLDLGKDQVSDILGQIEHGDAQWVESSVPGITFLKVQPGPARSDRECQLVRMEPRVRFPHHGHKSDEWGFVIQGEVTEDSGEVYRPGDIVFKDQTSRHSFVSSGNQPFLFFVIHGGLEFERRPQ